MTNPIIGNNQENKSNSLKGIFLILGASILWGTTGTSQALAPPGATPLAIGAMRLMIGGIALAFIAYSRGGLRSLDYPPGLLFISGFLVALYQVSFFNSVKITGVAAGTVVGLGSSPFFAGLLDYFIVRKKPGRKWYYSTLLAVAGCSILGFAAGDINLDRLGLLLALIAGFAYASYALTIKLLIQQKSAEDTTAAVFCLGALLLSPVLFFSDLSWLMELNGWIMILHLGLFATALSYYLFAKGLEYIPVSSAVTLSLAEPLTAALLGIIIVGEKLTLISTCGLLLILSGIFILAMPGNKKLSRRNTC